MKQTYYSNGKLLLTGEYLVLDGATALALPTKTGQYLDVTPHESSTIVWQSYDADGTLWFETTLTLNAIVCYKETNEQSLDTSDRRVQNTLLSILHHAYRLQPSWLANNQGCRVETRLSFPRKWGLGTSSTLINNVAQWVGVDAFELLSNSFGGSGYDIACAKSNVPILYQLENKKPKIRSVAFSPAFASHLYFVYLNQKQSSKSAIESYYAKRTDNLAKKICAINKLTNDVVASHSVALFAEALQAHEREMCSILGQPTVQERLFWDFEGVVKSLGAWGGDFVLAVSDENPTDYFTKRGFATIIPYAEMIL